MRSKPSTPRFARGLLAAIPRASSKGEALVAIPGSVPVNPGAVQGCAFAPRCVHAFARCHAETPPLQPLADARHTSACFLDEGWEGRA